MFILYATQTANEAIDMSEINDEISMRIKSMRKRLGLSQES